MLLNLSLSSLKLSYPRQLPSHHVYHYFSSLPPMRAAPRQGCTQNEQRLSGHFQSILLFLFFLLTGPWLIMLFHNQQVHITLVNLFCTRSCREIALRMSKREENLTCWPKQLSKVISSVLTSASSPQMVLL